MAKTKAQLRTENSNNFPNNNSQFITPEKLRGFNNDIIDSLVVSSDTGSYVTTSSFDNGTRNLTFTKADGSTYTNNIPGGGGGSTDTGSLLTTASFNNGTRNMTFTKGDSSTFDVNIPGGDTGSLLETASVVDATITFTKADASQFSIEVNNVSASIQAEDLVITVKNESGVTLPAGTAVKATGVVGENITIVSASADNPSFMPAIGVLNQEIANNATGECYIAGRLENIDTSNLVAGAAVYVNNNGGLTSTKPTGSSLIQNIGIAAKINATEGELVIQGSGRSNDVPNIQEGYIWVGDSNGVAETIPSSSLSTGSFAIASGERLKIAGADIGSQVGAISFYSASNYNETDGWLNIQPQPDGAGRVAISWFPENHHLMFFDPIEDRVEFEAPIQSVGSNPLSVDANLEVTGSINSSGAIKTNGVGLFSGSSQVNVINTQNYNTLATTGSNTFTADQQVTGRVKQTLDAPADFNQEDFIIINSASVVGNSYPITQFTIQDYTTWAGTDYEDAFVFEYWSAGYGFGSELSINGIHTKLETSPSGSGFSQRATLRTQDNQDGTSTAQIEGNTILLGNTGRSSLIKSATPISSSTYISASAFIGDGSQLSGVAGGIFIQTGSYYSTTNDLQITGSLGVSKAIGGKNSNLTITSNTASIDLTQSNTFTVTLVSSADTHLDVSTFGEDAQSVNVLVKQPTSGNTGSISFSPDFKFGQGSSYQPTAANSSEDIVSFTRFGNHLYGTFINNFS